MVQFSSIPQDDLEAANGATTEVNNSLNPNHGPSICKISYIFQFRMNLNILEEKVRVRKNLKKSLRKQRKGLPFQMTFAFIQHISFKSVNVKLGKLNLSHRNVIVARVAPLDQERRRAIQ